VSAADGQPPQPRTTPIPVTEVPCVQMLSAGVAIVEDRPRTLSTGLTAEALRAASVDDARLRGLELNGSKDGRTSRQLQWLMLTILGWSTLKNSRESKIVAICVPRPGVEPGLRPRASHEQSRSKRPNIIEVFDLRPSLPVGLFCPHL